MKFTLYCAECAGDNLNTRYPRKAVITNAEELKEAIVFDHVGAEFAGSHRSKEDFLCGDVAILDCDNEHSDNPDEWITPEQYEDIFPNVCYAVVPSRSNGKAKGSKSARPRHHVYFPHREVKDAAEEGRLKKMIHSKAPFFDSNALDGARFLFGSLEGNIVWHDGDMCIDEFLELADFVEFDKKSGMILEGSRNSSMSKIAGRIVKRYGYTDEAHSIYMEYSNLCSPPLEDAELEKIWASAEKFWNRISQEEGYIQPDEYNGEMDLCPEDFSDIGQARVLCNMYKDRIVYTDATDFMCYDGIRWVESKQLAIGACEEFLDIQLDDAIARVMKARDELIENGVSEVLINAGGKALEKAVGGMQAYRDYAAAMVYKRFVMKRRDMKYVLSALQAAKPIVLKDIRDFDQQEFLLNTPAGTYDLRYGMAGMKPHSTDNLITKVTQVSPDNVNEKLWLDSVAAFFCGDVELMEYVQHIVGLAAIGKVYQEFLIIAHGEGSNGKSTFWNAISRVLGSYSGALSADSLTVGCKRNVKPEMAELKGKRLVIAAELEEGMRLNTSIVKQLCSTDEVSAEKKYHDPFRYVPTHTLVLYTNHLPRVGANDEGTWRRLIVIPFEARIKGKSDIKNYADYLVNNAGGAVLKWIIEGAQKVINSGFHFIIPEAVKSAVGHYRSNNDWLSMFIDDRCEVGEGLEQKSGEFYQEYRAYCIRCGEYIRSTADFYSAIEIAGFRRHKKKAGIFIQGIRLKSDFME